MYGGYEDEDETPNTKRRNPTKCPRASPPGEEADISRLLDELGTAQKEREKKKQEENENKQKQHQKLLDAQAEASRVAQKQTGDLIALMQQQQLAMQQQQQAQNMLQQFMAQRGPN